MTERIDIRVRASAAEREVIRSAADRLGMTVSDFVLQTTLARGRVDDAIARVEARLDEIEERLAASADAVGEAVQARLEASLDAQQEALAEHRQQVISDLQTMAEWIRKRVPSPAGK